jgi:hypothetical protein
MADEQPPQDLGVDPSPIERGVEAAPSATMRRLEAQVVGRRDAGLRGEEGVGQFKGGVGPAVEAFRRARGGSRGERRKVPWCAHHVSAEGLAHSLAAIRVKTQA